MTKLLPPPPPRPPTPGFIHGQIVDAEQAFCDVCGGLQPLAHFNPDPFIAAHPFAAHGISARDLREWQRGWGGDGHSGHRALRLQLDRRSRTTRVLALAGLPEGRGWDGVVDLELATRPNVLDTVAKGVRARAGVGGADRARRAGRSGGSRGRLGG